MALWNKAFFIAEWYNHATFRANIAVSRKSNLFYI